MRKKCQFWLKIQNVVTIEYTNKIICSVCYEKNKMLMNV